jgi:hypothetical protein
MRWWPESEGIEGERCMLLRSKAAKQQIKLGQ